MYKYLYQDILNCPRKNCSSFQTIRFNPRITKLWIFEIAVRITAKTFQKQTEWSKVFNIFQTALGLAPLYSNDIQPL